MSILTSILLDNIGRPLTFELVEKILDAIGPDDLDTCVPTIPVPVQPQLVPGIRSTHKRLVIDEHERIAAWVAARTGCDDHSWAGYACIGLELDGELVAGVVIEGYTGSNANIHVAGTGRNWLNRALLFTVFDYAFNQLKLKRLTGLVPASNDAALRFDLNLGFEPEAILPDGVPDGPLVVLVMWPENCRYLRRP